MIDILIIEDSEHKSNNIIKALEENSLIRIKLCKNVKDARKALTQHLYDVLLLDLVLPLDPESEPTQNAGVDLLKEIYYRNSIRIPAHIIGITQFDELFDKHNEDFDDKLWHLINFDLTNTDWREKLMSKINYIIENKKQYLELVSNANNYDIGIICALNVPEFESLLSRPFDFKKVNFDNDPIDYYEGIIVSNNDNNLKIISCSVNHMGMHASAAVAAKMISRFSLKYIFIVGICAGVRDRGMNLGDILIANTIWDHGLGKITENSAGDLVFKPEPYNFPTSEFLLSKLSTFSRKNDILLKIQAEWVGAKAKTLLTAKIGPVASGSYVISSSMYLKEIIEHNRKLLGVDMEGYGVYRAASFFKSCDALMIKSICDFADEHKDDTYQTYASYTSASYLYHFIKNEF